jgi:hypothetical protein
MVWLWLVSGFAFLGVVRKDMPGSFATLLR